MRAYFFVILLSLSQFGCWWQKEKEDEGPKQRYETERVEHEYIMDENEDNERVINFTTRFPARATDEDAYKYYDHLKFVATTEAGDTSGGEFWLSAGNNPYGGGREDAAEILDYEKDNYVVSLKGPVLTDFNDADFKNEVGTEELGDYEYLIADFTVHYGSSKFFARNWYLHVAEHRTIIFRALSRYTFDDLDTDQLEEIDKTLASLTITETNE